MEPDPGVVLEEGDVVVLLGTAAAVTAGEVRLLQG
jgi:K+/H+ antiporter YhaU regulatory subunit KhtT